MPFIRVNALTKKFHQSPVINEFSYFFQTGKIYLLTGENGCGKTTLIKMILRLVYPTKGRIEVEGGISYTPDKLFFANEMKLIDFIKMLSTYNYHYIIEYLRKYDILEYKNHKIKKLSKGAKHKVLLLIGLMNDRDIYLFDEPLNGLDEKSKMTFITDIVNLMKKGKLVIVATHFKEYFSKYEVFEVKL